MRMKKKQTRPSDVKSKIVPVQKVVPYYPGYHPDKIEGKKPIIRKLTPEEVETQRKNQEAAKYARAHDDISTKTNYQMQTSSKTAQETEDEFREGAREGVREALEKNKAQSIGDVVDKITSDEYREDVNYLQDLVIDKLEEKNPVVGKTLRAVDNFLDSVDSFISDFVKSANKIVGDIMAWGKKLFGG